MPIHKLTIKNQNKPRSAEDIRAAYEQLRQWADDAIVDREDYYAMRQQFILTARVVDDAIDELLALRKKEENKS